MCSVLWMSLICLFATFCPGGNCASVVIELTKNNVLWVSSARRTRETMPWILLRHQLGTWNAPCFRQLFSRFFCGCSDGCCEGKNTLQTSCPGTWMRRIKSIYKWSWNSERGERFEGLWMHLCFNRKLRYKSQMDESLLKLFPTSSPLPWKVSRESCSSPSALCSVELFLCKLKTGHL